MSFNFEKLKVYQRAQTFCSDANTVTQRLNRGQASIADQLVRASTSIPLNIAEGNGRWHPKERASFFRIAKGSVFECIAILDLLGSLDVIEETEKHRLKNDLEAISRMLSGLIKGIPGLEQPRT